MAALNMHKSAQACERPIQLYQHVSRGSVENYWSNTQPESALRVIQPDEESQFSGLFKGGQRGEFTLRGQLGSKVTINGNTLRLPDLSKLREILNDASLQSNEAALIELNYQQNKKIGLELNVSLMVKGKAISFDKLSLNNDLAAKKKLCLLSPVMVESVEAATPELCLKNKLASCNWTLVKEVYPCLDEKNAINYQPLSTINNVPRTVSVESMQKVESLGALEESGPGSDKANAKHVTDNIKDIKALRKEQRRSLSPNSHCSKEKNHILATALQQSELRAKPRLTPELKKQIENSELYENIYDKVSTSYYSNLAIDKKRALSFFLSKLGAYNECLRDAISTVNGTLEKKEAQKYKLLEKKQLFKISRKYINPFIASTAVVGLIVSVVAISSAVVGSFGVVVPAVGAVAIVLNLVIAAVQSRRWVIRKTDLEKDGLAVFKKENELKYSPNKLCSNSFRPIHRSGFKTGYIDPIVKNDMEELKQKLIELCYLFADAHSLKPGAPLAIGKKEQKEIKLFMRQEGAERSRQNVQMLRSDESIYFYDAQQRLQEIVFEREDANVGVPSRILIQNNTELSHELERKLWLTYLLRNARSIQVETDAQTKRCFTAMPTDRANQRKEIKRLEEYLAQAQTLEFKVKKELVNEPSRRIKSRWFDSVSNIAKEAAQKPPKVMADPVYERLKEIGFLNYVDGFDQEPDVDGCVTLSIKPSARELLYMRQKPRKLVSPKMSIVRGLRFDDIGHAFYQYDVVKTFMSLPESIRCATFSKELDGCSNDSEEQKRQSGAALNNYEGIFD